MEDAAGRQGEHMQETSPTGTTLEVGVMLTELISGSAGISGLMGDSDTGKCQNSSVPLEKIQKRMYPRNHMVILMF